MPGGEEISESSQSPLGRGYTWAPRVDPNCGEYGLFVNPHNEILVSQGDNNIAITSMRIILNNQFAPMPVCGWPYASSQFIGKGSTEFSMQLAGIGDDRISDIQSMHEELEENARVFRKFEGAARVRFSNNEFLRLAGIYDGIITSVDTETDSSGTNLYRCQLSFTADGHHTESFGQEQYVSSDVVVDVLESLLSRIATNVISPTQLSARNTQEAFVLNNLGRVYSIREDVGGLNAGVATALATVPVALASVPVAVGNALGIDRSGNPTSVNGILESARSRIDQAVSMTQGIVTDLGAGRGLRETRDRLNRRAAQGAYSRYPIITPTPAASDDSASYNVINDTTHAWVNTYTERVAEVLNDWVQDLPPATFFRGPLRGAYFNYFNRGPVTDDPEVGTRTGWDPEEGHLSNWPPILIDEDSDLCGIIHGRQIRWRSLRGSRTTNRDSIETNLFNFVDALMSVAQLVLAEAQGNADFNDVFPGIQERWAGARRFSSHPTYPDLNLPPHPVSNLVIDTEPDYYFFNDGEAGLMNEVGPELASEIDTRLENMENSYSRLSSGTEWNETYLGRSRVAIPGYDDGVGETPIGFDIRPDTHPIDNATDTEDSISWGPEGGRPIGGGTALVDSVVDNIIGMSPAALATQGEGIAEDNDRTQRRIAMLRATNFSIPQGDPNDNIGVGPIDSTIGRGDRAHTFSRGALRTIVHQSVAQAPEETLTMRRAFPSFKIYFVEDDIGAGREHLLRGADGVLPIMFFDDLYNYNSVKNIRLIRSRKNPADLLVLQLTNVQGLLERRKWTPPSQRGREIYAPGLEDTELENPLKKIIMKEGLKVQARLGYTNDPNKMGIKFIGEVVEVSYNAEVSDEVTLICQSYGAELALEQKGISQGTRSSFVDTPDLLHTVMCSPELVHFGRYDLNPQFNPAEARGAATSRNDASTGREGGTGLLVRDPRAMIQQVQELLIINRSKWIIANDASDDNIFAPGIRDHLTVVERFEEDLGAQLMWGSEWITALGNVHTSGGFWNHASPIGLSRYISGTVIGWIGSGVRATGDWLNTGGFNLSGQTIWEILKESELRHPGWVSHPRPYGTRQTLFFGIPSHRYWADQQSRTEMIALQRISSIVREELLNDPRTILASSERIIAGETGLGIQTAALAGLADLTDTTRSVFTRTARELAVNRWLTGAGEYLATTLGRFRPFRRYHLITSDHHILTNNIRASQRGTFNAVSLQYSGGNVYTLKADDSIPDELTRVQSFNYPSCDNETMARRYCIGLLNRHLKDVYKGEVYVTGMDVDPYDMCYLQDDRIGMYGGFEIEQVVDTFTPQSGWVTEITPDLITGTNEWATRSTAEARTAVIGALAHRYMGVRSAGAAGVGVGGAALMTTAVVAAANPIAGLAIGGVMAAGGALAWMGGYHIIRWSQDRQPIWVCPLILGERPFFAGLDGFRQDGIFASVRGELSAQFDNVQEGWRQWHLAAYANDVTHGLARAVSGQGVNT